MMFNKSRDGTYRPGAWWVGSLADHLLDILFSLFDSYEEVKNEASTIEEFASEWLSRINWKDQKYLEKHILGIAVKVAGELYGDDNLTA